MTDAERLLWLHLRDRRLQGYKFRRQFPLAGFVADFACLDAKLIVEADGCQHLDKAAVDQQRTEKLSDQGYRVLRFWNDDVLLRTDDVLEEIRLALTADRESL
jgi:very-short-patch-repair endonuclease